MINEDLLKFLCCPVSKKPLIKVGNFLVSTDPETRRRYKIIDDIPILILEESEVLPYEEWVKIVSKNRPGSQ